MIRPRRHRERGYALPEVLVATAIAAAVLTASASALGGLMRLEAKSAHSAQRLNEAEQIATRLRAGMSNHDALAGLSNWRIVREEFDDDAFSARATPFDRVTVSYGEDEEFVFKLLAPHAEGPQ